MGYWEEAMEIRMNIREEVDRLETVLLGHLYLNNEYAKKVVGQDVMEPLEFWDSKRPYGNKNIENSIAFNLGWDYKRVLTKEVMPEWVKDEARKVHDLLRRQLEREY